MAFYLLPTNMILIFIAYLAVGFLTDNVLFLKVHNSEKVKYIIDAYVLSVYLLILLMLVASF